jgi:hypothetical protein
MKRVPLFLVCLMFCFPVCNVAAETVTFMGQDGSIQAFEVNRGPWGVNVTQTMDLDLSMDDLSLDDDEDVVVVQRGRGSSGSFMRGLELGVRSNRLKNW